MSELLQCMMICKHICMSISRQLSSSCIYFRHVQRSYYGMCWNLRLISQERTETSLILYHERGTMFPDGAQCPCQCWNPAPRKHGLGSIKAARTSCSLIKILWNSGSANGLLLRVCRYVGCLGSFKERCQPNVFPVTCTAEGNVLPKGPTSRWISFCSH